MRTCNPHAHIHMHTYTDTCTHTHTHTHAHTHMRAYAHMHKQKSPQTPMHMHVHMHICKSVPLAICARSNKAVCRAWNQLESDIKQACSWNRVCSCQAHRANRAISTAGRPIRIYGFGNEGTTGRTIRRYGA